MYERYVWCVAWLPDSRLVASGWGYGDKTVHVWPSVVGGTQTTQHLRGHSEAVTCVVWGRSNAGLLVSCSGNKAIMIWHLEGESAHTAGAH